MKQPLTGWKNVCAGILWGAIDSGMPYEDYHQQSNAIRYLIRIMQLYPLDLVAEWQ